MSKLLRPICWIIGHDVGNTGGYIEGYQCDRCGKWGIGAREL